MNSKPNGRSSSAVESYADLVSALVLQKDYTNEYIDRSYTVNIPLINYFHIIYLYYIILYICMCTKIQYE